MRRDVSNTTTNTATNIEGGIKEKNTGHDHEWKDYPNNQGNQGKNESNKNEKRTRESSR